MKQKIFLYTDELDLIQIFLILFASDTKIVKIDVVYSLFSRKSYAYNAWKSFLHSTVELRDPEFQFRVRV